MVFACASSLETNRINFVLCNVKECPSGIPPLMKSGMVGKYKVIDKEYGHFSVSMASSQIGERAPADIPSDAIEYGLTAFGHISKGYKYNERIIKAAMEALRKDGLAHIFVIDGNEYYVMQLRYDPKYRHLIVRLFDGTANSIDLSKVDVSIK
jgi:hypothetical protein